jgi:hypothetical protein
MMSGSLFILSDVGFVLSITMGLTIPVIRRVNLCYSIHVGSLLGITPANIFCHCCVDQALVGGSKYGMIPKYIL